MEWRTTVSLLLASRSASGENEALPTVSLDAESSEDASSSCTQSEEQISAPSTNASDGVEEKISTIEKALEGIDVAHLSAPLVARLQQAFGKLTRIMQPITHRQSQSNKPSKPNRGGVGTKSASSVASSKVDSPDPLSHWDAISVQSSTLHSEHHGDDHHEGNGSNHKDWGASSVAATAAELDARDHDTELFGMQIDEEGESGIISISSEGEDSVDLDTAADVEQHGGNEDEVTQRFPLGNQTDMDTGEDPGEVQTSPFNEHDSLSLNEDASSVDPHAGPRTVSSSVGGGEINRGSATTRSVGRQSRQRRGQRPLASGRHWPSARPSRYSRSPFTPDAMSDGSSIPSLSSTVMPPLSMVSSTNKRTSTPTFIVKSSFSPTLSVLSTFTVASSNMPQSPVGSRDSDSLSDFRSTHSTHSFAGSGRIPRGSKRSVASSQRASGGLARRRPKRGGAEESKGEETKEGLPVPGEGFPLSSSRGEGRPISPLTFDDMSVLASVGGSRVEGLNGISTRRESDATGGFEGTGFRPSSIWSDRSTLEGLSVLSEAEFGVDSRQVNPTGDGDEAFHNNPSDEEDEDSSIDSTEIDRRSAVVAGRGRTAGRDSFVPFSLRSHSPIRAVSQVTAPAAGAVPMQDRMHPQGGEPPNAPSSTTFTSPSSNDDGDGASVISDSGSSISVSDLPRRRSVRSNRPESAQGVRIANSAELLRRIASADQSNPLDLSGTSFNSDSGGVARVRPTGVGQRPYTASVRLHPGTAAPSKPQSRPWSAKDTSTSLPIPASAASPPPQHTQNKWKSWWQLGDSTRGASSGVEDVRPKSAVVKGEEAGSGHAAMGLQVQTRALEDRTSMLRPLSATASKPLPIEEQGSDWPHPPSEAMALWHLSDDKATGGAEGGRRNAHSPASASSDDQGTHGLQRAASAASFPASWQGSKMDDNASETSASPPLSRSRTSVDLRGEGDNGKTRSPSSEAHGERTEEANLTAKTWKSKRPPASSRDQRIKHYEAKHQDE